MNIIKTEKGYYYKIYKNNKKKRVSKLEYEKCVKRGGSNENNNSKPSQLPHLSLKLQISNYNDRTSPVSVATNFNPILTLNTLELYKNNNLKKLKNLSKSVINEYKKNTKENNYIIEPPIKKLKKNNKNNLILIKENINKSKNISTFIFNNKKNNKIIKKKFIFHKDNIENTKNVLNEIIMHKYALILTDEYNKKNSKFKFKVPKIINITYYLNPNNEMIEVSITMEKLNKIEKSCNDLEDSSIYDNIISYLEFLRSNGLFHNDTHPGNLFFIDDKDYEMGLIDFGQSNTKSLYSSFLGIKIKNNTNNHNIKIKKLQLWCNKSKNNWSESY